MKKLNFQNNIYKFNDYNNDFFKLVNKKWKNLIYILDIETPSCSGIDAAIKIREIDNKCYIIFITSYFYDYAEELLSRTGICQCASISKNDLFKNKNYEEQLMDAIDYCIKHLNKPDIIQYCNLNTIFSIKIDDIIFAHCEKQNYIQIESDKNCYVIHDTLKNFAKKVNNDDFVKIHKACIINKSHITKIDHKNKIIYFDCNKQTNLVARDYKKRLGL